MADFLLEIGTEEIPARMIDGAREELSRRLGDLLTRERLASSPTLEPYSTPRRIAVLARGVSDSQPDSEEQVTGPATKVAFKDGQPQAPALAFAKKVDMDLSQIERVTTPKGEYLSAKLTKKGRPAADILSEALPKEIAGLYWAKNMYWRPGRTSERFVRPVRWMVAMLDGATVPVDLFGTEAGKQSEGHRILGSGAVTFPNPAAYKEGLLAAHVVADPKEREYRIRKALDAATRTIPGGRWREDKDLLDTVVNLTEFPSVILGSFDHSYLTLPEEVLVTVMRDHQKYFAVEDADGKLAPYFLAVLNTSGDPQGLIRHGNERVLRARFNDARFFWNTDQKHDLRERVGWLKNVTFQKDLGSYYDKTMRVQALASQMCEWICGEDASKVRSGVVHKAALLAKTDLTTELVKEFTELQGIVGGLYARAQQLDENLPETTRFAIGDAIYDQYKPHSMEDSVPRSIEGAVVSIADKADSIAGMFALGLIPSGSKDPFALRRQANGIVKIIAEHKLSPRVELHREVVDQEDGTTIGPFGIVARALQVYALSEAAARFKYRLNWDIFRDTLKKIEKHERLRNDGAEFSLLNEIATFFRERLEFYLRDSRGFTYDVVNAVLAAGSDDVLDAVARAEAIRDFRQTGQGEDFEAVCLLFKRIKNILPGQLSATELDDHPGVDETLILLPAEQDLWHQTVNIGANIISWAEEKDYSEALSYFAGLKSVLNTFFDQVLVNDPDERLKMNRVLMLRRLFIACMKVADFSEIVTERK